MKIGLFIPSITRNYDKVSASIWIRCLQMVRHYRQLGADVSINNPINRYDVAVYYRGMGQKSYFFIKYLKQISKRVYWDTVVNYYVKHRACSDEQFFYAKKISGIVDGIIVSSKEIERYASAYNKSFYMPDPVDIDYFKHYKKNINLKNPIFGWSGISGKSHFLSKYKDIINNKITLIMEKRRDLGFNYTFYPWSHSTFPGLLSRCDIGFFPRNTESLYNKSHSSFKILAYAIQGIPIITNKIPSYVQLAKHYKPIYFLEDHPDIFSSLEQMASRDRDITEIKKRYSCDFWAGELLTFFNKELNENSNY